MGDPRNDLVSIDDAGVVRPVGPGAVQQLRARKGVYRLLQGSAPVVVLRHQPEAPGAAAGPLRLAGEVVAPGALCDVVALIARSHWRGELSVIEGDERPTTRLVFFEAGSVVGARSDAVGERLGEIMYRLGALSAPQVQSVMARLPFDAKRRFGETAVDLGFLDRERLFHFAARQAEEILFATLRVGRGAFAFVDHPAGVDDGRLAARVHLPALALLGEGIARMDDVRFFRERIPSPDHVPARAEGRLELPEELLATRPAVGEVWSAIDGQRSVLELSRAVGRSELEVTQQLFQLVHYGFAIVRAPAPTSAEALVATFNEAMVLIHEAAARSGRAAALAQHLATYRSGVGVLDGVFAGAGPRADETVDPAGVARNIVSLAGDDPLGALSGWLHEYAAFALFDMGSDIAKSDHLALSKQVRARLALLAPKAHSSIAPPSTRARSGARGPSSLRAATPPRPPPPRPLAQTQRLQSPSPTPSSPDVERGWTDPPPPAPSASTSPIAALPPPPLPAHVAPPATPSSPRPPPPSLRPVPLESAPPPALEALALAESAGPRPSQAPPAIYLPEAATPSPPVRSKMSSFPPEFGRTDDVALPDDDFADAGRARVVSAHAPARRRLGLWVLAGVLLIGTGLAAFGFVAGLRSTADVVTEPRTIVGPSPPRTEPTHAAVSAVSATSGAPVATAIASASVALPASAAPTASILAAPSATLAVPLIASAAPSASATPSAKPTTSASIAAPSAVAGSGETTVVRTTAAGAGHRVFVDGRVIGEGPGPLEAPCGAHTVKVGSGGKSQALVLPCGGELTLSL